MDVLTSGHAEVACELANVSMSVARGANREVLFEDISLSVMPGEVAAVVAQRGNGKTTLAEIACGLRAIDGGSVRVWGADLAELSDREFARVLRSQIGRANRQPPPYLLRVAERIEYSLYLSRRYTRREMRERLARTLVELELELCARCRWNELSHFQRVRAALAQAIVASPRLLIVDDLLAGLALTETIEVFGAIEDFAQRANAGVLMIAGDFASVVRCVPVWHLHRAKLQTMCSRETATSS